MPEDRNGMTKYLQELVDKLKAAEIRIKELENEVSAAKAARTELEQVTIPDYMSEHQVNSVGLYSGQVVTVKPYYYAREFADNKEPFRKWLVENGHGGLIKESIEVTNLTNEKANYLEYFLSHEIGPMYDRKATIHWNTLTVWFKEQVEHGVALPIQLFNNFIGRKATVK